MTTKEMRRRIKKVEKALNEQFEEKPKVLIIWDNSGKEEKINDHLSIKGFTGRENKKRLKEKA